MTRYRPGVPTAEHLTYSPDMLTKACVDFGATLAESSGGNGRVHLLAGYPPKASITAMVNSLKGASARSLRQWYQIHTHRDHP